MKRIILAATIAAATFAGPVLAEQYVCQTEQTTGFAFERNGRWRHTRFTNQPAYLVDTEALTVTEFGHGTRYTNSECEVGTGPMREWITCSNTIRTGHFTFNSGSMRFAQASIFGSVGGGFDEPWMAIGTCAELGS